jgi:hypothetical protein
MTARRCRRNETVGEVEHPAFENPRDNAGSPFAPVNHAIWSSKWACRTLAHAKVRLLTPACHAPY